MTHALTWQYLSPEHVHRCLGADGPDALYRALIAADADNSDEHKLLKTLFTEVPQKVGLSPTPEGVGPAAGPSPPSSHPQQQHRNSTHGALYVQPYAAQQQQVALDLFFHLILKCREHQLTPEKTSAAVGIVARTHSESMRRVLSLEASYALFGQLLQLHAVHRPPFAAAVLTIEDAKVLTDFFLGTYYRHYKLYLYAFTPRRVATVRAFTLAEGAHDVPPLVPPQSAAVPLAAFEAARDEVAAAASAKAAAAAREEKAREDAERQRVEEEAARIPPIPSGLQAQLSAIRSGVVGLSVGKLSSLEAKLDAIEARIAASQQSAAAQQQPLGATAGRKGAAVSGSPKRR